MVWNRGGKVDALHVHTAGTLSALTGGSALTLGGTGSENTCLTSWVPWLTLSGLTHECMVGVDGTNPSPCLLLQGAAILELNHPELLAPTTAGLSTHESEPDPARASTAAAPFRGGSSAVSEGCYEAEASDRGTATATRAGALRGLVPNGVSCTSARVGDQAVCDPPAGSRCAVAAPYVWVRARNQLHDETMRWAHRAPLVCAARDASSRPVRCNEMQCDEHIAHHWCVLQEMRAADR